MDNKNTQEQLDKLVGLNFDSAENFSKLSADLAAEGRNDVAVFNQLSMDRHKHATELAELIRRKGGDPPYEASMGNDLRRIWINITGGGLDEVVKELLIREEELSNSYRNLLAANDDPEYRELLEQQQRGLEAARIEVSAIS